MATEIGVGQNPRGGALAEFEEIYRSNVGVVAAYFARRCWEPQEVADLTSETVVRSARSARLIPVAGALVRGCFAGNAAALKAYKAGSNGGGSTDAGATAGGNHVVRMQSGGSKFRTQLGADNHVVRMYCP